MKWALYFAEQFPLSQISGTNEDSNSRNKQNEGWSVSKFYMSSLITVTNKLTCNCDFFSQAEHKHRNATITKLFELSNSLANSEKLVNE